jgi:ATP-binding cassette subfamily C (CFTR/MRP) protein 1
VVGQGKSTLLQSLVGNTEQLAGELSVPRSTAFQPQTPILFDQTIRANILFGEPLGRAQLTETLSLN